MYKRYHLETARAEVESTRVGKFTILRNDLCANCGQCADWCIYDVHKRDPQDPRLMADPVSCRCKNCFSCIQNCPRQAIEMVPNSEYEALGNSYWTPHKIWTIWGEAEAGMIPVFGAGYRGPFRGTGFDEIWTDMSEIVRPTRDGIHGREYIATAVDIGRKLPWIPDFQNLSLPSCLEIQVPMLFETDMPGFELKGFTISIVKAASLVGTLAFLKAEDYSAEFEPYLTSLAMRFTLGKTLDLRQAPWRRVRLIEIDVLEPFSVSELEAALEGVKVANPQAVISIRVSASDLHPEILKQLEEKRADVLHYRADIHGQNLERNLFISDSIRAFHREFVRRRMRDEITILGCGGIAAAEHVPKLVICGADAVILDLSLLVAAGCRVCRECSPKECPAGITAINPDLATQRMVNMVSSWRDQLLEILSAMGMKDVRRLRGEVGRAMFYEEIERKSFASIFNERGKAR